MKHSVMCTACTSDAHLTWTTDFVCYIVLVGFFTAAVLKKKLYQSKIVCFISNFSKFLESEAFSGVT